MKKLLIVTLSTAVGFIGGLFTQSIVEGFKEAKNAHTEKSEKVDEAEEKQPSEKITTVNEEQENSLIGKALNEAYGSM